MDDIDTGFSFYDDPDYSSDADRDSRKLKAWHQQLWSKTLPNGDEVEWLVEPGGYLTYAAPHGPVRVSSDTIATTHANYARFGVDRLWAELSPADQLRYERAFYTIGGFIIFPVRPQSLNQVRGTASGIADRFDLTLECIRQHYLGENKNPRAGALDLDAAYFRLFGEGPSGFDTFVAFFHLQDLVSGSAIRWFDDFGGDEWDFESPPLPQSADAYRRYLDKVLAFVDSRNARIQQWCDARDGD